MRLQLVNEKEEIVAEYDLGNKEGEWDIHSPDEAGELVATISKEVGEYEIDRAVDYADRKAEGS